MRKALVALALTAVAVAACKKNRDAEVTQTLDDLRVLDDAVEDTVKAKPNDDGVAAAESLLAAKKASLHDRIASYDVTEVSPEAGMAINYACVRNRGAAEDARDYVMLAVLESNPALVERVTKMAIDLCSVCPQTAGLECATIRRK